jgi:hypothetical protein
MPLPPIAKQMLVGVSLIMYAYMWKRNTLENNATVVFIRDHSTMEEQRQPKTKHKQKGNKES